MTDPDPYFDQVLEEIGAFSGDLYANAGLQSGSQDSGEETRPLYQGLLRIRERYENPELIARGGMKEIYRVYDRRATRHVALAKPAHALGEDGFDAFLREAHITARLDHPGIVKLFDMGIDDDGRPFFTMELKKGRSLRELLRCARKGGEFPMRRRLEILLRICEAISYAHSRRVLHLDLKPENIQVGEFGEVHVCDWGMGVVIRPTEGEVRGSEVLLDPDLYGPLLLHSRGTRGYMAPEQFKSGQAKSFGMDVFALGCVLQELVLLESPDGDAISPKIPYGALGAIISKARHPSPEKRYRSVDEFSRDLSRHLTGHSASVEDAGFFREMLLFYRRNRTPCRLVGGLVALILALTLVFIGQLRGSREEAVSARETAEQTQQLYLEQKVAAETALRDYRSAREESDRRLLERADMAAMSVTELTNPPFLFDDAILPEVVSGAMKHLDAAIAHNPPPESPIWYQKFWLLFMSQDFTSALSLRDKNLDNVADLVALAEKYAPATEGRRFLSTTKFSSLMADLAVSRGLEGHRLPMIERMLVFDLTYQRPPADRADILRAVLSAMNPGEGQVDLAYDSQQKSIHISGSRVRVLSISSKDYSSGLSLLRFLNPHTLSLRGTGVTDLKELHGLDLLELDLRDTRVHKLEPLGQMRSLRQVVASPGQFTGKQLSVLPSWIEVTLQH